MVERARPPAPAVSVLAAGGLDPSGGAGILADLRSLEAAGVVPLAVATALTLQSGRGVAAVRPVAADFLARQVEDLVAAFGCRWIKVGQVPTARAAAVLARLVDDHGLALVLDPVLAASGGGRLVGPAGERALVARLLPRARVVTVNLAEAARLARCRVGDTAGMEKAARRLLDAGAGSVIVKGGHLAGPPIDLLCEPGGRMTRLAGRRIAGPRGALHGTGCAYASALTAALALGETLPAAARDAAAHVRALISGALLLPGARVLRAPRL